MGKRKHYDAVKEEHLKRQKSRIRRERRQRSYSLPSSMSSKSCDRDYAENMDEDQICADEHPFQEG